MLEEIKEAVSYIQPILKDTPEVGIVLGSGLGKLTEKIEVEHTVPYTEIPNFPVSTVKGHSGMLICGRLGDKQVIAMKGRFHYYEGYNMQQVVFPIRVMKLLGIKTLFLSNASGGVNESFGVGDVMIITDHINLFPDNPLRGANPEELGPRFPDMSEPYDQALITKALSIGAQHAVNLKTGVYAGTSGPTFETPAEYKFMQAIGADAVGMSTVPEVIAARHMGLPCFALSVITDMGVGDAFEEVSHEKVLEAAASSEPKLTKVVTEMIHSL